MNAKTNLVNVMSQDSLSNTSIGLDLKLVVTYLLMYKWSAILVLLIALLFSTSYAMLADPVYRSSAKIEIKSKVDTISVLDNMESFFSDDRKDVLSEIQIIVSETLIGQVTDKMNLDIMVRPKSIPLLSELYRGVYPAKVSAPLGLDSYSWQGDSIVVDHFLVPSWLVESEFVIKTLSSDRVQIISPFGDLLGDVGVGRNVTLMLPKHLQRSADGNIVEIKVSALSAGPGVEFLLERRLRNKTVDVFRSRIRAVEKLKGSGVISISISGKNPVFLSEMINEIVNTYVAENLYSKETELTNMLDFVDAQLPRLKGNLEDAETKLNVLQKQENGIDIDRGIEQSVVRITDLEKEIVELKMSAVDAKSRFKYRHPMVTALNQQIASLGQERDSLIEKISQKPDAQLEVTKAIRELTSANELYTSLLHKSQEIRLAIAGVSSDVNVIDYASIPYEAIKPQKALVIFSGLILGILGGVMLAVIKGVSSRGIGDLDDIEGTFGLQVKGIVPFSKEQSLHDRRRNKSREDSRKLLALESPSDIAIEGLRSLRSSLYFSLMESDNNIIMISSPLMNAGKSFISSNLACVFASSGMKTVVIDADMRRGRLYRQYRCQKSPGLSEFLSGQANKESIVQEVSWDAQQNDQPLYFISTGEVPKNPSELLLNRKLEDLLAYLNLEFDVILIDTPPVINVTDATIIARQAGIRLLAVNSKNQTKGDLELALRNFNNVNCSIHGAVINSVHSGNNYGYKYGYGSYYRYYKYAY